MYRAKHLSIAIALTLLAGLLWNTLAQTPTTYTVSLTGDFAGPGSSGLSLEGAAAGALPGVFTVSLNFDTTTIVEGNWTLVVKQKNEDGSEREAGMLSGKIVGGTATFTEDGRVSSVNVERLSIQSGTGDYAGITSGGGTLAGTINTGGSPPFSGTLSLDF